MHTQKTSKAILAPLRPLLLQNRMYLIFAVLLMCVIAATEASIPKIVKDLLDKNFQQEGQKFWHMPLLIILLAFVRSFAQFFSQYFLNYARQNVLVSMRQNMFAATVHAQMPAILNYQSSSLIHLIIFELEEALSGLSNVVLILVRDSLTVLALCIYLVWMNWQLSLVMLCILPPLAWMIRYLKKRLKTLNQQYYQFVQDSAYQIEQMFKGLDVIKSYQAHTYERDRFAQVNHHLRRFAIKIIATSGLNQPITQMLASIALAIVLMLAIWQAQSAGQSVGTFTAFVMAMMLIISPLKRLADVQQPIAKSLLALDKAQTLLELPREPEHLPASSTQTLYDQPHLRAENIAVHVQGRAIVSHIDMDIPYGKKVAVVGGSGSGKTTLMRSMLGFVPFTGAWYLNAIKIADFNDTHMAQLRSHIAYVGQDSVMFYRSIAQNVAYAQYDQAIDMARVRQCLADVNLLDWAQQHGLDYLIKDSGQNISGGQRQRLAIARALYHQAPIMILDEASSALDATTQHHITEKLLALPHTIIAIAHRLHTIQDFDWIFVMDQGQIVEQGRHTDLLAQNGMYAHLWRHASL